MKEADSPVRLGHHSKGKDSRETLQHCEYNRVTSPHSWYRDEGWRITWNKWSMSSVEPKRIFEFLPSMRTFFESHFFPYSAKSNLTVRSPPCDFRDIHFNRNRKRIESNAPSVKEKTIFELTSIFRIPVSCLSNLSSVLRHVYVANASLIVRECYVFKKHISRRLSL